MSIGADSADAPGLRAHAGDDARARADDEREHRGHAGNGKGLLRAHTGERDVGPALDLAREWTLIIADGAVMLPDAEERMLAAAERDPTLDAVVGISVPLRDDGTMHREHVRERVLRHMSRLRRYQRAAYFAAFGYEDAGAILMRSPAGAPALHSAGADALARVLGETDPAAVHVLEDPVCAAAHDGGGEVRGAVAHVRRTARDVALAVGRVQRHRRRAHLTLGASLRLASSALVAALGMEGLRARWRQARQRMWQAFAWRTIVPLAERLYDTGLRRLGHWPIGFQAMRPPKEPAPMRAGSRGAEQASQRRVVYYLWRYPVLSETFVQREIEGLRTAGIVVKVVADAAGAGSAEHDDLLPLIGETSYVHPVHPASLARNALSWLVRRPLRTLNLLAYTIFRPYSEPKSAAQDARVFAKVLRLASILREHGATDVHAPWGDTNAFVAMLAARLIDAPFSLQFRAQDLHRKTAAFLIGEKIRNASFVVTNTDFNLHRLRELSPPEDHPKIRRIYNGLPLGHLTRGAAPARASTGPLRLLTVARLIEPKGLVYLFEACRALADRGLALHCTVIGGPELPTYVNDLIAIRRAHHRLRLDGIVTLEGAQPFQRVLQAYREADIFVLPCVVGADASNDITPNVLLEAMAMGLPVVSTAITAIPELVEDGRSGILVRPNDAAALADAIERLMVDAELRSRLGAAAREHVYERFNVERNIGDYVELFAG